MASHRRILGGGITLLAGALGALLPVAARGPSGEDRGPTASEPAPFLWQATYGDALRAASVARRPLLVYFPPARAADEPRTIQMASAALGIPPPVEGVRVGAEEVLELLRRFRVEKVPAVLLLDRRENVVERWEGGVPSNLWVVLGKLVRQLEKRDEEASKLVERGRAMADSGDLEGAYRAVAAILVSRTTPPEALAGARDLETMLVDRVETEIIVLLAEEGMVPDPELAAKLSRIRSATQHPGLQAAVDREVLRLTRGTLGAR